MWTSRLTALLLVVLPAAKLLVHLYAGGGYGYHRDELYYLACARHLDWGYVDHPPLSILLLRLTTAVLGEGVAAIRVVPALAGAATVLLVGLLARRLGGGPFAVGLAMSSAIAAPSYLALDQYYSMNALDIFVWGLVAWILLLALRGGSRWLWPGLGVLLGLGLLNKLSVGWLIFGLGLGLLVSPERRWLRTPWPWLALALAIGIFLPHLVWQARHDWPTLEFVRNAASYKLLRLSPQAFALGQVGTMLVFNAPVWLAGLAFFLFLPGGRGLRTLGWAYVAIFALFALGGTSRDYYLTPAYTWLLAAGGVVLEGKLGTLGRGLLLVAIVGLGLVAAPLVLPLLPLDAAARYAEGRGGGRTQERSGGSVLTEFLGHMADWPEIAAQVARVHAGLPEGERSKALVVAPNYGVAGALDRYGPGYGLPPASSPHNSYWLWGPVGAGDPAIVIGRSEEDVKLWFSEVSRVGTTACAYCMSYENDQPIFVARRPRVPIQELWRHWKHFD